MISPELLRRYPFFGGLTEAQLAGIAMIAEDVSFPEGATVFEEGKPATKLYVLVEGSVGLTYSGGGEGRVVDAPVGDVAAGELLTLSALLEPYKVTTTARAEEPSRLISIDAAGLRAMCEVDARLGYTLMRHLAQAIKERLDYTRVQLAAARPA
jgi:CRP/FNR family cyclic AMP-dependent transcriptional regulator